MNRFEMDVDVPDKSIKFLPRALHSLSFPFLIGTTSADYVMASILHFKDGRHVKTYIYYKNHNHGALSGSRNINKGTTRYYQIDKMFTK